VAITVEASHTCYRGERGARHAWGPGCGACPACELRARGWEQWQEAGGPELAA
jgi:7-cyano-7-deazaguanine synthase